MDTIVVFGVGVDRGAVLFDYYCRSMGKKAIKRDQASIKVSEKVQDEDVAICDAVQKGLASRAYVAGRLSVRREAGEHLFHRLLHADLTRRIARHETSAADREKMTT